MRITQANVAHLTELLLELENTVPDLLSAGETWLGANDKPRTEELAEETRNAREEIEDNIDALFHSVDLLAKLLS